MLYASIYNKIFLYEDVQHDMKLICSETTALVCNLNICTIKIKEFDHVLIYNFGKMSYDVIEIHYKWRIQGWIHYV